MKDINLYIIRHGQTEWNLMDRMQGSKNSPLTPEGIEGAKITGRHLKDISFMQAYSSNQQRALETRDYIVGELNNPNVPTKTMTGLKEMDFGEWEGVPVAELRKIPEFNFYMDEPTKYDAIKNKGETYTTVLERMQNSLDEIIKNAPQDKGNILIVSHGTALRLLLCVLNGGHWHYHRQESYFPRMLNTSISLVNYQGEGNDGKYAVEYFNNVDHINNSL